MPPSTFVLSINYDCKKQTANRVWKSIGSIYLFLFSLPTKKRKKKISLRRMMYHHPVAMALVLFLRCFSSVVEALSFSSLLPSSKQRTATTVTSRRPQHPHRRQAYSTVSAVAPDNKNTDNTSNSNNTQNWSVVSQKSVAALWTAPVVVEQSPVVPHHRIASHHTNRRHRTDPSSSAPSHKPKKYSATANCKQ